MRSIFTLGLTVSLFASIAVFADDGNQGGGNRTNDCTDPNNCPPEVCTQGCPAGGPVVYQSESDYTSLIGTVSEVVIDATAKTIELVIL